MRLILSLTALLLLSGCGEETTTYYVGETPPADPGAGGSFTPGDEPPPGDDYGSGYGNYGEEPECANAQRRCPHTFELVDSGAQSVALYGSYTADGWQVGVPMTLQSGTWRALVDLPWDEAVQYKLSVDDNWIIDPQNPNTVDDGLGGLNSLLSPMTCDDFSCVD